MTTFKQRFKLAEGYLSAILLLSGSIMAGVNVLQKGDFKTAGAFFMGGLITSAFTLLLVLIIKNVFIINKNGQF